MWDIVRLPLFEIIVVGALCGLSGVFGVLRRRVFFAESITHSTFPSAVLGVVIAGMFTTDQKMLSIWLFIAAFAICIPMTVLMRALTRIPELSGQAAAGIVLTLGFGLGYFFDRWFAPLPLHVDGFLTGSLLHVNTTDLTVASVVLAGVLLVTAGRGRHMIFRCFDADGCQASGIRGGSDRRHHLDDYPRVSRRHHPGNRHYLVYRPSGSPGGGTQTPRQYTDRFTHRCPNRGSNDRRSGAILCRPRQSVGWWHYRGAGRNIPPHLSQYLMGTTMVHETIHETWPYMSQGDR